MTNETIEILRRRRSVRAYQKTQVGDDALRAVVESALYAPHAGGQAWHFTAVQSPALLTRLNAAAKRYAASCGLPWLEQMGQNAAFDCLYGAPTLILVSCDAQTPAPDVDAAAATMNLLTAAESVGLGACWIYFVTQAFLSDEGAALREATQIPEGYTVYASVALGYREDEMPEPEPRKPGLVTYIR